MHAIADSHHITQMASLAQRLNLSRGMLDFLRTEALDQSYPCHTTQTSLEEQLKLSTTWVQQHYL